MVGIGVAEQHHVQLTHAQTPEDRHHHALAQVGTAKCRSGVIEHRMLAGAQNERQALTDVQLPDFDLTMGDFRLRREHRQHHQGPAQQA
ncbi:hypothetical protein D3C80_932730 [compost metagenome]